MRGAAHPWLQCGGAHPGLPQAEPGRWHRRTPWRRWRTARRVRQSRPEPVHRLLQCKTREAPDASSPSHFTEGHAAAQARQRVVGGSGGGGAAGSAALGAPHDSAAYAHAPAAFAASFPGASTLSGSPFALAQNSMACRVRAGAAGQMEITHTQHRRKRCDAGWRHVGFSSRQGSPWDAAIGCTIAKIDH